MSKAAIVVQELTFQHEASRSPCLNQVSFSLNEGEIGLLLGPSGSGKSTLLFCLNAIIPQLIKGSLSGQVVVDGLDVGRHRVHHLAERIGLVFQNPESQFCTVNVADEVAFGLENLRWSRPRMRQRVGEVLQMVGLRHKEGARIDQLSGGEMQKLALASGLAMDPQLLLFDAPTANLDPVAARDFYHLLYRLKQETGKTMLIVEQQLDMVIGIVDRLLLLNDQGQLVANGTPAAVLAEQSLDALSRYGVWTPQLWELAEVVRQRGEMFFDYPLTLATAYDQFRPFFNHSISPARPVLPAEKHDKSSKNPILRVRDLSYTYAQSDTPALNQINLTLQSGDFCAIVGQNGAGKTTLIKNITGILPPPPDTVFLKGENVSGMPLAELTRHIGYVFQNPEHQFVADTVFDELAYSLRVRGLAEASLRAKVEEIITLFDLGAVKRAHPFSLSHGQKRQLSVATVLICEPDILILDEPTLGLDKGAALALMELLQGLNEEGKTILFITHDMRLTADYAHSVIVMAAGSVIFQGTPHALFEQPEIMETAALIAPPVVALSWQLRQEHPDYPLATTVAEFNQQLQGMIHVSVH